MAEGNQVDWRSTRGVVCDGFRSLQGCRGWVVWVKLSRRGLVLLTHSISAYQLPLFCIAMAALTPEQPITQWRHLDRGFS
jgi:hypothetical protein